MRDIQVLRDAGERIAMLTAYDHVMAGLLSQSGIDMIWIGMATFRKSKIEGVRPEMARVAARAKPPLELIRRI
ncbi:MAG: hypothetical protein Devi2KO_33610 [Devosia indica]